MDRAHRIGQKKVVNVYRLITRGTLEEKIMGLQKFKLMTANTVISCDNAGLETMATEQVRIEAPVKLITFWSFFLLDS